MKEEQCTQYMPPRVKIVEIKAQAIICQSVGEYNDPFGEKEDI